MPSKPQTNRLAPLEPATRHRRLAVVPLKWLQRALLLLALVGVVPPSRAFAADDVLTSEAQQRFQEGLALHDAGRDDEAYAKFAQAYALLKAPPLLFHLARAEQLTGRLLDAARHFREYIALDPAMPAVSPELRQRARECLGDLSARLGHIVVTATAGAAIALDGRALEGHSRDNLDVLPGTHTLEARLGARVATASIALAPNETRSVTLDVSTPPVDTGAALPFPPPSRFSTPVPNQSPDETSRTWVVAGLAVAALAAAGSGFGLELAANGDAGHANQLSAQIPVGGSTCYVGSVVCEERNNANHAAQDKRNVAAALFAAGAVAGAGAIGVLLLWSSGASSGAAGPAAWGVQLAGRF
jgi:hypothetical protein